MVQLERSDGTSKQIGFIRKARRGLMPRTGLGREQLPGERILPDFIAHKWPESTVYESSEVGMNNNRIVVRLSGEEAGAFGLKQPVILYQRESKN